jgi:tagatose-1,6-bisphosphate aldolase
MTLPVSTPQPGVARPGNARHLRRLAPGGRFVVFALDHRRNLWDALAEHRPADAPPLDDAAFTAFKRAGLQSAYTAAITGVLTDPQYGLPAVADSDTAAARGLLLPLEVTDYSLHASRRHHQPIPGWSVAHIKRAGADGVKLLVYHHPEAAHAAAQQAIIAQVAAECAAHDIPFFCEPIAFSPDETRPLSDAEYTAVVIENARIACSLGIDVLKSEYPARPTASEAEQAAALAALDAVCRAHGVPWTLLSGSVDYARFSEQVARAMAAGASGVIVGRAVWGDAIGLDAAAQARFWAETCPARIDAIARQVADAPGVRALPGAGLADASVWWAAADGAPTAD